MGRLAQLEYPILKRFSPRRRENSLEAVRVAALGKKADLRMLATLARCRRRAEEQGAAINLAKDQSHPALTARRDILKSAALDDRCPETRVTLPLREAPAEAAPIHPLSKVFEEVKTIFAKWICDRRSPRSRPTNSTSRN